MEFFHYKMMANRCEGRHLKLKAADLRQRFLTMKHVSEELRPIVIEAACEEAWCQHRRPFFNVWPPIFEMIDKVDLTSVPAESLPSLGIDSVLVRMPRSFALYHWVLVTNPSALFGKNAPANMVLTFEVGHFDAAVMSSIVNGTKLDRVEAADYLEGERRQERHIGSFDYRRAIVHATKLVALLCMMRRSADLFSPVVLAKDRSEYVITADEDRKRLLEERAARKEGVGFDVGREWYEARDASPHYRNAHLALFWTGRGRSTPVVKLRNGCVVNPKKLTEMPTGYMGPEDIVEPEPVAT